MSCSWKEIENHWILLRDHSIFNLSAPCIVINKDGDLFENTLNDLVSYIDIPTNTSIEQISLYLTSALEMGSTEAAAKKMIDDDLLSAQNFLNQLNVIKHKARNITLGTIDDVFKAIQIAKKGFSAHPRKMLIIQLGEYRGDLLLVSPPTNDGRRINDVGS